MILSNFCFKLPLLDKLQMKLRSEGGIRALLGMVRCGHPDVLSQVARGIANFAKCESRATTQGLLCPIHIIESIPKAAY